MDDMHMTGERGGAHAAAQRIAEAAAGAWYRGHGPHHTEAMIGTVAALALDAAVTASAGPEYRERIRTACRDDAGAWLAQFWTAAWVVRPDLITVAAPLYRWLSADPPAAVLSAAAATASAAIAAGVVDFGSRMRHDADLLGLLVQEVHSRSARSAGGVFHSPPEIGALASRLITAGPPIAPGERFADECAGTGELARATAGLLRERGMDPAAVQWFLNDRDEVAAACAAVNAMLWELGPRVAIGCADILAAPDWERAAALRATAAREHRDDLVRQARGLAALIRLTRGPHPAGAGDDGRPQARAEASA